MVEIAGDERERHRVWLLNEYQAEGLRMTHWLADGVQKFDRTTDTYVNLLLDAGFELMGFSKWYPTAQELEARPEWVADTARRARQTSLFACRGDQEDGRPWSGDKNDRLDSVRFETIFLCQDCVNYCLRK
jgi:hypothetical protein